MLEALSLAAVSVSALFFVVNPIGLPPLFLTLTAGQGAARRQATAAKACLIFVGVLVFFTIGGQLIFQVLGIGLGAFKIAGGLLLLLTAVDMLRHRQSETRTSGEEIGEAVTRDDVAVVPLAMPIMAGPGAIATVMVLAARSDSPGMLVVVLGAVCFVGLTIYLVLRTAHVVDRYLGINGRSILERITGLLLAAIAVQFMVGGVRDSFPEIFPEDPNPTHAIFGGMEAG